jgi:hypothetical protein
MAGVVSPILSKADFVEMFRPLVGAEDKFADLLLMAASNQIRRRFSAAGIPLDESDPEVTLVVYELVAAVLRPGTYAGYSSVTITTDNATEQRVFVNPNAAIDISDAQWARLGISLTPAPRGCFPVGDY